MHITSIERINKLEGNCYSINIVIGFSPSDFTCFVSLNSLRNWKAHVIVKVAGKKIRGKSLAVNGFPTQLLCDSSKDKPIFAVGRYIQRLQKEGDRENEIKKESKPHANGGI